MDTDLLAYADFFSQLDANNTYSVLQLVNDEAVRQGLFFVEEDALDSRDRVQRFFHSVVFLRIHCLDQTAPSDWDHQSCKKPHPAYTGAQWQDAFQRYASEKKAAQRAKNRLARR